ncbi:T9SS type A sorting domain-containing protein [Larkinella sp. GY13]|uniref:T9SS type A sorting domain-containing protein n=1 Tax=Larkinella sp. GY13 TaxID=3453720 RepID=UPI003EED4A70
MAALLLNRRIPNAKSSGFQCLMLCGYFLLAGVSLAFGQSSSVHLDSNGFFQLQIHPSIHSAAARKTQNAVLSVTDDARRPANAAILSVSFDAGFDINAISFLTLVVKTSTDFQAPGEVIYISGKALDKGTRTLQIPVGGLKENTDYYFTLYHSSGCDGDETGQIHYKTGTALKKNKKVLLVMDNQYENDSQVQQALTVYKTDATRADPNLVFEQTYLSADPTEKGQLYEKIKARYFDSEAPLHYLFFIGRIPNASIRADILDHKTNQPLPGRQTWFSSLGVYAKILTQDFPFDPQEKVFISRRYDCQLAGKEPLPNDIAPVFFQSSVSDISYGALVPTRPEEGKAYILRYFEKLHQFKTGTIKFDKKVLLADTFYNDGGYPKQIEQLTGRWKNNDTINVPQKYGANFHGFDPVWQADYLKKLGTNSYEIVYYSGHGEPVSHYYGITPNAIRSLEKLNTLLFDFASCSVGNVDFQDYLAGTYLDKGNTLFVNSYSTPIVFVTYNNQSPLLTKFKENQTFYEIAKGAYVSDAYRYGFTANITQYLLGDPLLLLDPPQCNNAEPLTISTTGATELCPGDTATLRLSTNFTDVRWFRNGQEISGAKGHTLAVTQGGLYTAKAKRCEQEVSSDQGVSITLKPGPETPVITLETFPDRFRLRVTPAGKFTSFSWFINGERWTETTRDTTVAAFLGDYTVRVSQDGCSALSKPVSVRIEKPALSVTTPVPLCTGDSVALKAPDNFSSYTWLTKDGPSVTTTRSTRFIKQSASVAVTPKRGNLEGPTSDYVTMNFSPKPPKPTVTLESNGFRSSSATGNQWYRNGQPLPDSTRQVLRNPGAGTYTVRVTGQGGCFNDSDPMIITAVEPTPGTLKVYPNPGNGTFWVEWPDAFRSGDLEVVDNLGRKVYSRSYTSKPVGPVPVRLKTAPGLYLMRLSNAGQIHTVKVVIETD